MYTKAKDSLPNAQRLENLTWRMMAMTLKKKLASEAADASRGRSASLLANPPAKTPPAVADREIDYTPIIKYVLVG